MRDFPNLQLSAHPLAAVALARLRDATTAPPAFRTALATLAASTMIEPKAAP